MSRQRWFILFVLAVIGYGSFALLYPRFSPALDWRYQLDRALALQRAQEVAQDFGVATAGWKEQVTVSRDRENPIVAYLRQQPAPAISAIFSSFQTVVTLTAPASASTVRVRLNAQGRLISFSWRQRQENNQSPTDQATPEVAAQPPPPGEQALVEAVLQKLAGAEGGLFTAPPKITRDHTRFKHTWTAKLENDPRLTLTAEISTREGQVREAVLSPDFSEEFKRAAEAQSSSTLSALNRINGVLILPIVIFSLIIFFVGWGNGELLHRPALWLLALATLFLLVVNLPGTFFDDLNIEIPLPQAWLVTLLNRMIFTFFMLLFAIPLYFFWISGHSLAARLPRRRTVAFELLLQGKLNTRYLGQNFAAGILLGGLIAALPFWIKLLPAFSATPLGVRSSFELFGTRSPALATLASDHTYGLFLFFAFVVPLIEYYVPRKLLAGGLILLTGSLWLLGDESFALSAPAALLTGCGMTVIYYAIYRQFDFLAVLTSSFSGLVALHALALLAQPVPSLRVAGWTALSGLALTFLASGVVAWRGHSISQDAFAPLINAQPGAERERLKADLEVASRAQQQMLPDEPPQLPGYDIAAICRPSKDVGGDLYDFINLPDGRLGIVVADVSGKGVPAALYMTLTKGLLASVAEEQSDPGAILREVNRHLYEACRKKVFVTLFLGVLDPATRTLTYARAGHNPTVWRSPRQNTTELLRPSGMGLGLNQGKIFNTTLKVAQLQLAPQDALFFYSDGITEAMNAKQEEYGEERLMALAEKTDTLKAGAALASVMADVSAFLGSIAPQDDQTLVVLKVS
jgi:serine phosphatase RsbU (regulator of sigma subunit)